MTKAATRKTGQIAAFRKAAKEHECDESEARFNEALRTLVKNPDDKGALDKLADALGQNEVDPNAESKPSPK